MTSKTKKRWLNVFKILAIIFINTATIFFLISKMINITDVGVDITYWEALTNKAISNLVPHDWIREFYHWYNDLLIYLFMALGYIGTFSILKYWHKIGYDKKRDAKKMRHIDDTMRLKTLIAKIESGVELTQSELKEFEKLSERG